MGNLFFFDEYRQKKDTTSVRRINKLLRVMAGILIAASLVSCDDDSSFDHDPPDGKGSMIVDNNSATDTGVYLNGTFVGYAKSGDSTIFDLEPGHYRLVLDAVDGSRNYRDDIDVLEDRLTILDVLYDAANTYLYYVIIYFE